MAITSTRHDNTIVVTDTEKQTRVIVTFKSSHRMPDVDKSRERTVRGYYVRGGFRKVYEMLNGLATIKSEALTVSEADRTLAHSV